MGKEYFLIKLINMSFNSIIFASVIEECTNYLEDNRRRKNIYIIVLFLVQFFIPFFTRNNEIISLCLFNLMGLAVTLTIYSKDKLRAIVGFSFVYDILIVYCIFNRDVYKNFVPMFIDIDMSKLFYRQLRTIFLSIIMWMILKLKRESIKNILELIIENNKLFIVFISGQLILNIIFAVASNFHDQYLQGIKIIFSYLICSILILMINYIENIMKKSQIIEKVNDELEIENDELRKVKHDYGAQVSYLYGIFLLKRWDDLKESLDKIIETNNSISSPFIISSSNDNSIIKDALEPVLDSGIHVVIEENIEWNNLYISKDDLFFIVRNIGKNIADLIGTEGIISVKIHCLGKSLVIDVEAFKVGDIIEFENKDDMLDKIKEVDYLIKKNNGTIYFNSNKILIQVKILFSY